MAVQQYYTPAVMNAMDRDARNMAGIGTPLSGELENIREIIQASTVGQQSLAADVDSVCLGGGEFTQDVGTSPAGVSLNFSWLAGRFHNGMSSVAVAAGTITLTASATNYVQVSRAGVVSSNTTGFTAGQLPLWTVVAGVSNWAQAGVTSTKNHLCLIGANGVTGAMLSVAGETKELLSQFGAISAASTFLVVAPNVAATLTLAEFVESVAVAQSDTNYWTWAITNLGQLGVGTTPMLNNTAANTTKLTGGSALSANVARQLQLNSTPSNLNTAANDVLQVTITPTGAPTALAQAMLRTDFTFQT